MTEYVRITFKQIRERAKSLGVSEDKMREDCYRNNPQYSNPDDEVEKNHSKNISSNLLRFRGRRIVRVMTFTKYIVYMSCPRLTTFLASNGVNIP